MSQSIRSYAAAGAAIAVAGAVAVAPAPAQALPDRALASVSPTIQLTTTEDPFTVWMETFETTFANFTDLTGAYFEAPFPVVQQVIANWFHYATLLPDIGDIFEDIVENADALVENLIAPQTGNLSGLHPLVYEVIAGEVPEALTPVLEYTTNYNSGMVIGALGLVVSPLLALGDQLSEFVDELTEGDLLKAANALINIPAAMTNAFFNGHGILDLTFLADILPVPSGVTIDELGLAMGGLLSPAGSIFNSVNAVANLGFPIGKVTVAGVKAGLIGSWFAANQSSAEAIGWSGTGNPLAALGTDSGEEGSEEEGSEEEASEDAEAPAAASTAADLDSEEAAPSVDVVSDDADVESDVSEVDADADGEEGVEEEVDADVDGEEGVEEEVDADVDGEEGVDDEVDSDEVDSDEGVDDESDADADNDDSGSDDSGSDDSGSGEGGSTAAA